MNEGHNFSAVDWQTALDAIDDSVAVYDTEDRLVAWNRAFELAWGEADVPLSVGLERAKITLVFARKGHFGEGDPEALATQRMASTMAPGDGAEVEIVQDGQLRRIRRFPLADGGLVFLRTNADDHAHIRGQLEYTSEILKTVFETLDQPACVWDSNQNLVAWNTPFAHMNGMAAEDMTTGMHALDVLRSCARCGFLGEGDVEELAQARFRLIWENPFIQNDMIERAGRIYDAHRGALPAGGFVTVFNDVTEREKVARELMQAKEEAESANAVKTQFLANMSHELRTPLNAILGFSDLMIHSQNQDMSVDKFREYVTDIRDSAVLLMDIINDLLDLAKIETGRFDIAPQEADLRDAVTASLNLIRHMDGANGVTFQNDVAADFPALMLDEMAFRQILLNLLSNAVKATPDGGCITVTAAAADTEYTVDVSDTGGGIPEDTLPNIFDAYEHAGSSYVRAANSTGLGLSIVKRLMELHGGTVRIEDTGPDGTNIRLRFPRTAATA